MVSASGASAKTQTAENRVFWGPTGPTFSFERLVFNDYELVALITQGSGNNQTSRQPQGKFDVSGFALVLACPPKASSRLHSSELPTRVWETSIPNMSRKATGRRESTWMIQRAQRADTVPRLEIHAIVVKFD